MRFPVRSSALWAFLAGQTLAATADPRLFRWTADLPISQNGEISIALPGRLLEHARTDLADLQLVTPGGKTLPWTLQQPPRVPRGVPETLTVLHTSSHGDTLTVDLALPEQPGRAGDLELLFDVRNFRRKVALWSCPPQGPCPDGHPPLALGEINDFSAAAPLRQSTLALPPLDARRLHLLLTPLDSGSEAPAHTLPRRFPDLAFLEMARQRGPFDIRGAIFHAAAPHVPRDTLELRHPFPLRLGNGTTLIDLGHVAVPLDELLLDIANAHFRRSWILEGKPAGKDWILLDSGWIASYPGHSSRFHSLRQPVPAWKGGRLRLRLADLDLDPLEIRSIKAVWPRRVLHAQVDEPGVWKLYWGQAEPGTPAPPSIFAPSPALPGWPRHPRPNLQYRTRLLGHLPFPPALLLLVPVCLLAGGGFFARRYRGRRKQSIVS